MDASTIPHRCGPRPTPLLRLQTDDRLAAQARRGSRVAYETLVARHRVRLLAFCRHILEPSVDAERVLEGAFTAAFGALQAGDGPIDARPWLYRVARDRCLDHLRRHPSASPGATDAGVAGHRATMAGRLHRRGGLAGDLRTLPEPQRTALLLREGGMLSYEQVAEVMDTTVPALKALLVHARVSLAEAAQDRTGAAPPSR